LNILLNNDLVATTATKDLENQPSQVKILRIPKGKKKLFGKFIFLSDFGNQNNE